jgi:sigma-B regulation protein RsbU (phosphoserine phosphatase)
VLFTDGVTEAEGKERELFGTDRIIEALRLHGDSSLGALQEGILGAVERFTGGISQSDDITLLVVRYLRDSDELDETGGSPA